MDVSAVSATGATGPAVKRGSAEPSTGRPARGGSLTAAQVAVYEEEGYLVLPDFLDDDDLAPPREAMMQKVDLMAADLLAAGLITDLLVDEPFRTRLARLFEGLGEEEFLAYGRSWRDRIPGYYLLMSNAKILDAIESLIGPEIFSNPVYNVRPKVPRVAAGAVPWHQDKSYWPDANSNPVITVWISLVDATLENGCLHMIPRTQHRRVLSFTAETYSGTGYLAVEDRHLNQTLRRRVRPLPVKAGTAVLFNDRLIHSSTPNNSDHVRWSVDLRYQPTDQDPMPQYGAGFLARSHKYPDRVATLEDWLAERPEALQTR
ncbi:MAG: phytanoyl-CoA dioxygenase family protein [Acidimicrobiales bacterium]|jgi:ectoine hydroxylase-related dioxygenase (phytanoyl-CoA dioxygenase family)